ncbi:MAG: hypothetical protein IAG13_32520, partial [Deltaproteobacteria bacterium]|nr:hypothetical protein [Nannocystaceae bacterium]
GTATGGGLAGTTPGDHGAFGSGGSGTPLASISGGGGGWYGGGAAYGSGGGGGSSWGGDSIESDTFAGVQLGNGLVVITPVE